MTSLLRVFENKVLRRIFGLKKEEIQENGEKCIIMKFKVCTLLNIIGMITYIQRLENL
jgi:hypothetical protein